ncbi:hypothetical protein ITJ57_18625 [Plantibacter sp. VKM Ac-2880]|uniref:hypothetical protein n=1 Tax=Plantibacter sp. VKM Ac-2880 TaxID=2783827 RepID=UPI00188DE31A|nr:hypothetical protein [Plantibacter sp. VKM Ac-2880]MBF4570788.1 hypothetical protein [Plantibacter sp. VKM Ac-2880]
MSALLPAPKPGQQPRGTRKAATVRLPENTYEAYESSARDLGIPLGSYLALKLAEAHNEEPPQYVLEEIERAERRARLIRQQEELPTMARSA